MFLPIGATIQPHLSLLAATLTKHFLRETLELFENSYTINTQSTNCE